MEYIRKKHEFSMKYCPDLDDHVVVMKTDGDIRNKICLSAHLCHADVRMSCGYEKPGKKDVPPVC